MEKETLTEKKKCNAEQENEYILNVFKYYGFCNSLLIFIIHFQCSTMSYLMMLLLFLFYRRIALQSISYMVKTFAAKMLVAKMFTAEELMPKISPDHLLHPRCLQICMASLPSSLCASAHLFPLLRTPGGIPLDSFSWKLLQGSMMTHLSLSRHQPGTDGTQLSSPTHTGHPGRAGPIFLP